METMKIQVVLTASLFTYLFDNAEILSGAVFAHRDSDLV
jgi:hypothetical protein